MGSRPAQRLVSRRNRHLAGRGGREAPWKGSIELLGGRQRAPLLEGEFQGLIYVKGRGVEQRDGCVLLSD